MDVAARRTIGFCCQLKLARIMELKSVYKLVPNIYKLFGISCHLRFYSRYPKYYVEPLVEREEIKEVVKNKNPVEIEVLTVKAANNFATCSVFYDKDVHLLSRYLMRKGNSTLANSLVEQTFECIKRWQLEKYYKQPTGNEQDIELDPKKIFHKAVENCTPVLTTKKIIRSGTSYVIPTVVLPRRAKFLAMKFLIDAATEKKKNNEKFCVYLAKELIAASKNEGSAVQKKIDLHKYCEANRAYAHYRWANAEHANSMAIQKITEFPWNFRLVNVIFVIPKIILTCILNIC